MHDEHPAPLKTVLSHISVPIYMGLIMCLAYLGGFHSPKPHHIPVAIVGDSRQVQPLADKVQQAFGDKAKVSIVPTAQDATNELRHLDIDAAYVPGTGSSQLITASGASDSTTTVVEKMFRPVAEKQGQVLDVKDVAPLGEHDPIGQNGFFYLVALTVASYATAIAIGAAGATRPFIQRVGLAAAAAVVISSLELLIAAAGYDMFGGHVLATWGLSVLYSGAVLAVGVGLHPIVGRFSTLLYSAVFVALNFTSSGGVFAPVMQPAFFGWLHHFWIGSGFVETLRRITYFPDAGIAHSLTILFGWLVFGVLCLLAGHLFEQRRRRHAAAHHGVGEQYGELDESTEEELEENVAV